MQLGLVAAVVAVIEALLPAVAAVVAVADIRLC
jgi:hypothetical protein